MRGEDPAAPLLMTVAEGSPPHARGRHMVAIVHYANRRITPACAGKTRRNRWLRKRSTDHPRMRGEDKACTDVWNGAAGSPPHARGRRGDVGSWAGGPGITPACAGKTLGLLWFFVLFWDHPRMRGEDFFASSAKS